jgi:hypothetical protein
VTGSLGTRGQPERGAGSDRILDIPFTAHHSQRTASCLWLELAGDAAAAQVHYRAAAEQTTSPPERRFLRLQAARLDAATTEGD